MTRRSPEHWAKTACEHVMSDTIRNLSIEEKVQLVERLWDDIYQSSEPFPLQAWHREETLKRAAQLDAEPDIAITREELWGQAGRNAKQ
jgi:putative addiction module component (TIGR02574 family)